MTSYTSIAVTFNDPDEFLDELRRDCEQIDRGILRVTVRRRYGSPFVTVAVVATATVAGVLVKLENLIGEAFAGDEKTTGLTEKTQAALDTVTEAGKSLGLDVRAGVFESNPQPEANVLVELHGKAGALCEPAKLGHLKCPLIVRPTSEDNITAHLVHALRTINPRHWVSDVLNAALGCERFPKQVYRRFRVEPWVGKSPFPRHLIPWTEGGSEIDVQLSWDNPPTTVFVECKYGSALSGRTNQNDGSHGFPSDQLVRNIRVGLHECGYYRTNALFDSEPRDFAVIVLGPTTGYSLVREYRDPERLRSAVPHGDRITWPVNPFVGELGYKDIRDILLARRRFTTRAERHVIDALVEYLTFKHQTRPNRSSLPMATDADDPGSCGHSPL